MVSRGGLLIWKKLLFGFVKDNPTTVTRIFVLPIG